MAEKPKIEVGAVVIGIFKTIKAVVVSAVLFAVVFFGLLVAVPERVLYAIEIIKSLLGG